jgi:hypothetical protein
LTRNNCRGNVPIAAGLMYTRNQANRLYVGFVFAVVFTREGKSSIPESSLLDQEHRYRERMSPSLWASRLDPWLAW